MLFLPLAPRTFSTSYLFVAIVNFNFQRLHHKGISRKIWPRPFVTDCTLCLTIILGKTKLYSLHPEAALTPPSQATKKSLSPLESRERMVVCISIDEDYGPDPGLHIPETPEIRSSMARGQAALFSLDRSRSRGPLLAYYFPGACCVGAQAPGKRGAKKMARDLQE